MNRANSAVSRRSNRYANDPCRRDVTLQKEFCSEAFRLTTSLGVAELSQRFIEQRFLSLNNKNFDRTSRDIDGAALVELFCQVACQGGSALGLHTLPDVTSPKAITNTPSQRQTANAGMEPSLVEENLCKACARKTACVPGDDVYNLNPTKADDQRRPSSQKPRTKTARSA